MSAIETAIRIIGDANPLVLLVLMLAVAVWWLARDVSKERNRNRELIQDQRQLIREVQPLALKLIDAVHRLEEMARRP